MTEAAELIHQVQSYNPDVDAKAIETAVDYPRKMHDGQTRASGEPYYTHPVEVACILADMRMDLATIETAILHDTLEDTKATPEEIKGLFGDEVLMLINGVSKLTRIESQTVEG